MTARCWSGRRASQPCRPRLRRVEQRAVEKIANDRPNNETSPCPREVLARFESPLCGKSAKVRIKQRLSLQKDACQGKQSIRDTTESTTVRVAAFAHCSISGTTLGIALGGDTCAVVDRVAQSDVRRIPPDDDD